MAAGLFHAMKTRGLNVELITEYAKDMTWERRFNVMDDQLYMFAKQHRRQVRLRGQVDFVVTDAPLLLTLMYTSPEYPQAFTRLVLDLWHGFQNYNYFLQRSKPYMQVGRTQTELEAREIDRRTSEMLTTHGVNFRSVPGDTEGLNTILTELGLLV